MNASRGERRTWLCQSADRLGLIAAAGREGGAEARPASVAAWLLQRHVERCARCRAERAQWEGIAAAMRASRRVEAPPGILDGVLARIATERAHAGQTAPTERASRAQEHIAPPERFAGGLAAAFAVLLVLSGWSAIAMLFPQAYDALIRTAALLRAGYEFWTGHARAALAALEGVAHALPAGVQPYVEALWWSAAGLLLSALLISCLVRASARLGDDA